MIFETGAEFDMKEEWVHPGGRLREEGPEKLSEAELLAILISSGIRGRSKVVAGELAAIDALMCEALGLEAVPEEA